MLIQTMCLDCLLDAKQVLVLKNSYRFILYSLFDKSSRPGPSVIILPANAQLFFLFFEVHFLIKRASSFHQSP